MTRYIAFLSLILLGCGDEIAISSDPDVATEFTENKIAEPRTPSAEVLDLLYGETTISVDSTVTIIRTAKGWTAEYVNIVKDIEMQFSPRLDGPFDPQSDSDCPENFVDPIRVNSDEITDMLVTNEVGDYGQLCLPELGIRLDALPGRFNGATFQNLESKKICGTCQNADGSYDLDSTIVIIFED